jgi:hypothetical protein
MMRRIRISTWVLTAIFLVALVAYVLLKSSSPSTVGGYQPVHGKHAHATSPVCGTSLPGVIPGASPHSSPANSPSPGCSKTAG